jgi:hypothetical protein
MNGRQNGRRAEKLGKKKEKKTPAPVKTNSYSLIRFGTRNASSIRKLRIHVSNRQAKGACEAFLKQGGFPPP